MELNRKHEAIVIQDAGSEVRIAPELGFNCYSFLANVEGSQIELFDHSDDFLDGQRKPSSEGNPILFPYPNRIREGKFVFQEHSYHLPNDLVAYDSNGNAIHGFCFDRPWRVIDSTRTSVTGEFHLGSDAPDRFPLWPTDFVIQMTYSIQRSSLKMSIQIQNRGEQDMPWGFGIHPYFKLPFSPNSSAANCLIEVPAEQEWKLMDCLPTGELQPVSDDYDLREGVRFADLQLDHVFSGLPSHLDIAECCIVDEQAGVQLSLRASEAFREIVVFTPPGRDAICIEPYTCTTDAINLDAKGMDAGLSLLAPGEQAHLKLIMEAGLIVV